MCGQGIGGNGNMGKNSGNTISQMQVSGGGVWREAVFNWIPGKQAGYAFYMPIPFSQTGRRAE